MTTMIIGFSQFVINILLPSTDAFTRILLSSAINQFALVLETMEIFSTGPGQTFSLF